MWPYYNESIHSFQRGILVMLDTLYVKDFFAFQVLGRKNVSLTQIFKLFPTHCTISSLINSSWLYIRNIFHATRGELPKILILVKMQPMFTKSLCLKRGHFHSKLCARFSAHENDHQSCFSYQYFPIFNNKVFGSSSSSSSYLNEGCS